MPRGGHFAAMEQPDALAEGGPRILSIATVALRRKRQRMSI